MFHNNYASEFFNFSFPITKIALSNSIFKILFGKKIHLGNCGENMRKVNGLSKNRKKKNDGKTEK